VQQAKRGLLARAAPLAVHAAVFVVDASGARLMRAVSSKGVASKVPGAVALDVVVERGEEKLRYTRPAHFVFVVFVTEGASDDASAMARAAIADVARLRVVVDGKALDVGAPALARIDSPRAADLRDGDARLDEGARFSAAAVLARAAVHRVQETLALPLASADGKLAATAHLRVRL
jgi:hypothetical protein